MNGIISIHRISLCAQDSRVCSGERERERETERDGIATIDKEHHLPLFSAERHSHTQGVIQRKIRSEGRRVFSGEREERERQREEEVEILARKVLRSLNPHPVVENRSESLPRVRGSLGAGSAIVYS
jgi:hypothetical protein